MIRGMKFLPVFLFLISLVLFFSTLRLTGGKIQSSDFVLFPAITGLSVVILGIILFYYLYPRIGLFPLLGFHFLLGNFFILLPEIQITHHFAYLGMLFFLFIPPTMIHFAWLLSEMLVEVRKKYLLLILPYIFSGLLIFPYLYSFHHHPQRWIWFNYFLCLYLGLAYLFWIFHLLKILKRPHFSLDRAVAKSILVGQSIGFILPCAVVGSMILAGVPFPLHRMIPAVLLFPISLLFGVIRAKGQQMQTYLVQSEKRTTFGNLLSGLSHEIKNPLTFIYSNIEPLREYLDKVKTGVSPANPDAANSLHEIQKIIDNIETGVGNVKDLIDNFQTLPFQRSGQKEEIDLSELLEQCLEILSPKWKDKVQLKKRYETLPKIKGYRLELSQVFTNLLSNAFDASPEEGVVQLSTHKAVGGVKVVIRDFGKGIPKEHLDKIFDPFFTTKAQGKGMGLGLSIVLQKVKNHKGTMEVKSEVDQGTEFLIFLPY